MQPRVRTRRKNAFNIFREAEKLVSFDEFPMLLPEIDPQLHLSRNEADQPFYLICEKDCCIAQASGGARVEFYGGPVRHFDLKPGDYVYVPGGTPHRIITTAPGAQLRYKARDAGLEAVVWFCANCGAETDRHTFATSTVRPQAAWQAACERHNSEAARRTCPACGRVSDVIDMSPFRWAAVATALEQSDDD